MELTLARVNEHATTGAILHLHQHKYGHFDISPRNVLENDEVAFITCDFGMAKQTKRSNPNDSSVSKSSAFSPSAFFLVWFIYFAF
jgi:serine/threonine protein kinase